MFARRVIVSTAGLAATFGLAACATDESRQESADKEAMVMANKGEEVSSICFAGNIDSFGPAVKDAVVVRTSPSKRYLLETQGCFNLEDAMSLQIDNFGSCVSRGDYIIAHDTVFGNSGDGIRPQRCLITGTYEWTEPEDS